MWTNDGEIIFIGRKDFQVKIRGQRIELSEIENTIKEIKEIESAIVIDKEKENGDKYLVAYYISENNIEGRNIRDYLKTKLPEYMIPNYYININELPITINGKLDRRALPEPTKYDLIKEKYEAPQTEIEKIVCRIYSEIFGFNINDVGRMNSFYEMGGDSLNAIKIIYELKNVFGIKINIKNIMNNPKVFEISKFIEENINNENNDYKIDIIKKYNRCEYPITTLTYTSTIYENANFELMKNLRNNMYQYFKLNENYDIEKLKYAFNVILNRHKVLTSVFEEKSENDKNVIYGRTRDNMKLEFEHYTKDNYEQFVRKFDITKDLLIRVAIIEDSIIAIDIDHKVADGYSYGIIIDELNRIYNGEILEDLPIQYSDYAIYFDEKINEGNFSNQISYYKEIFNGNSDTVHLLQNNNENIDDDKWIKEITIETNSEVYNVVNNISKNSNISKSALFLTVYSLVLAMYSNQNNIYSMIITSNRIHTHTEKLVGLFMKYMPISLNIKKDKKLIELMKECMDILLTIFNFDVPYLNVSNELNLPLANICFKFDPYQMLNNDEQELLKAIDSEEVCELMGRNDLLSDDDVQVRERFVSPDISFVVSELENTYRLSMLYNSTIYEEELINTIINNIIDIIKDENNYKEMYETIFEDICKLDNPFLNNNIQKRNNILDFNDLNENELKINNKIEDINKNIIFDDNIIDDNKLLSNFNSPNNDDNIINKNSIQKRNNDNDNNDNNKEKISINQTLNNNINNKTYNNNKEKKLTNEITLDNNINIEININEKNQYNNFNNFENNNISSKPKSKFNKFIETLKNIFKSKSQNN